MELTLPTEALCEGGLSFLQLQQAFLQLPAPGLEPRFYRGFPIIAYLLLYNHIILCQSHNNYLCNFLIYLISIFSYLLIYLLSIY